MMKTWTRVRRLAFGALVLAAVAAFASLPSSAQSPETIRIGLAANDDSTPLIYAAEAGLFKAAGLDVSLQRFSGGAVVSAALAGGSLEIGKATAASAVAAYARGLPFTIIGAISYYNADNPGVALIVLADSEIKTASDLAGKTVGAVTLEDLGTLGTLAWLEQNGVDPKTVHFLELPQSAALASMQANRIVAMPVYEPMFSAAAGTGKIRVLGYPFNAIGRHFVEDVLLARSDWAQAHPQLLARFLRTVKEASTYVAAHETAVVPALARFGGFDPAQLANVHHPGRGVTIVPSDLQPIIDIDVKNHVIPKAFSAQDAICSCALRR